MEVDTIQTPKQNPPRAPLTPQERTQIIQGNGCFYCRKLNVNHRANNCPEKTRTAPRRNVNNVQPAAPAPAPAPISPPLPALTQPDAELCTIIPDSKEGLLIYTASAYGHRFPLLMDDGALGNFVSASLIE